MTLFRDLADREDGRLMSKQPSCGGLDAVFCVCFFFYRTREKGAEELKSKGRIERERQ